MGTEVEVLPPPSANGTAVVPRSADSLVLAAPVADVVKAQEQYHALCEALLDASDYQHIGQKDFRKKSGWRKLAVAFNVSCELLDRTYERDARGRIIRAECIVRATAPNGRIMDGLGACDVHEKCCEGDGICRTPTTWEDSGKFRHAHCAEDCSGKPHFSNPEHDVPATAMTRATNRACADLFGMGEVSAEEITRESAYDDDGRQSSSSSSSGSGPRLASEGQVKFVGSLADRQGLDTEAMYAELDKMLGHKLEKLSDLTMPEAKKVIDAWKGDS